MPRRPCEPMTMRSHLFVEAVSQNCLVGMSIACMRCVTENSGRSGDGRRFVQKLLRGVRDIGFVRLGRVHDRNVPSGAPADQRGVTLRTVIFAPRAFASPIA